MSTQRGNKRVLSKRVQLLRPLNTVEIVPMPYVTEGTRLHVLLPLTVHDRVHFPQFFQSFAANALDTHENLLLTLLFIYDPFDAQKVRAVHFSRFWCRNWRWMEIRFSPVSVCLSVCMNKISQKLIDWLRQHLVDRLGVWQGWHDEILVKIRIRIREFLKVIQRHWDMGEKRLTAQYLKKVMKWQN